jgi:hypothetical protein
MPALPYSVDVKKIPVCGSFPNTGYAWYVLIIFFLSAVISYADRLILNILVDPIRSTLKITDTQISLLQGAAFAALAHLECGGPEPDIDGGFCTGCGHF